jgi:hypothetical protein
LESELTATARKTITELYDPFRDPDRRIGLFDKKIDRVFRERLSAYRQDQGCRPEDRHRDRRRHWRRVGVKERTATGGRSRSTAPARSTTKMMVSCSRLRPALSVVGLGRW